MNDSSFDCASQFKIDIRVSFFMWISRCRVFSLEVLFFMEWEMHFSRLENDEGCRSNKKFIEKC
jgi:hypothetical protein